MPSQYLILWLPFYLIYSWRFYHLIDDILLGKITDDIFINNRRIIKVTSKVLSPTFLSLLEEREQLFLDLISITNEDRTPSTCPIKKDRLFPGLYCYKLSQFFSIIFNHHLSFICRIVLWSEDIRIFLYSSGAPRYFWCNLFLFLRRLWICSPFASNHCRCFLFLNPKTSTSIL